MFLQRARNAGDLLTHDQHKRTAAKSRATFYGLVSLLNMNK